MKLINSLILALAAIFSAAPMARADEAGTREEAKAMVDAAIAHAQKVGLPQAFKDFTTDKANWTKKDLYVMVLDNSGQCVAHGANERLVGKNLFDLKDPNGKFVVRELIEMTKTKGSGWVDYEWAHPQTKKIESKSTYARKLPSFDGWVGVGVYRQ